MSDEMKIKAEQKKKKDEQKTEKLPQNEYGGRTGPEPTRYGDWEKNGIISDF